MPRICAFYGIDIQTLEVIAGDLPTRAKRLVTEWAEQHQSELLQN